ncbi:DUF2079 domain-containing protein [Schlesneria sp. T3-172]|uniref:DUF2079 domain-containing protein n=1 Tax=Schlesneria sphaerica TaxID=3373610 RepID=UPI0037C9A827
MSPSARSPIISRLLGTLAVVLAGTFLAATCFQTVLGSRQLASNFISPATWSALTATHPSAMGSGTVVPERALVDISIGFTLVPCAVVSLVTWLGGSVWLTRRGWSWNEALITWGWYGWGWWILLDVWEWIWMSAAAVGWSSLADLLSVIPQFWLAGCLAGWITTFLTLASVRRSSPDRSSPEIEVVRSSQRRVWIAVSVYTLVYTAMNWRLYGNLLMPHGDSVMYEEHLWNLLHGKGFRSYLDQGLFLGEHIQFVHLFLLPLYVLWPSHLLLELCSSASLALGAFPVYWMAKRHCGSDRAAFGVAVAYLLYFPMQFLDIEIDLKTFRPESFGILLLLLTFDQLDRRNLSGTLAGIALCLTVKEDYTLIFGPLGLWIAFHRENTTQLDGIPPTDADNAAAGSAVKNASGVAGWIMPRCRSRLVAGLVLSIFSVAYLWFATRVAMPWFRSGSEVHYASYFARFGKTPEEILRTWLTQPFSVIEALLTLETALYAMAMLAPVMFLPLFSPGRLAVGLPLFFILCLNELDGSRTPQHQFHAPLVAVVFWSVAAGLPRATSLITRLAPRFKVIASNDQVDIQRVLARLVWTASLCTGLFFSLGPQGFPFWDPGSSWYWRTLYGPNPRSEKFARIAPLIPATARVASTDFVHPRFTHHERSYDYSGYQRKLAGEGQRIPADTDYLVIDTGHKYSTIKWPGEIPELRDNPEGWELLPDLTEGTFIVLKRKRDER